MAGAAEKSRGEKNTGGRQTAWLAVTSNERLLLRGMGGGRQVLVAASMTGHAPSDFAFAFLPQGVSLSPGNAEDFRIDTTSRGTMVWRDRTTAEALESCLAILGTVLFRAPQKGNEQEVA